MAGRNSIQRPKNPFVVDFEIAGWSFEHVRDRLNGVRLGSKALVGQVQTEGGAGRRGAVGRFQPIPVPLLLVGGMAAGLVPAAPVAASGSDNEHRTPVTLGWGTGYRLGQSAGIGGEPATA